MVALAISCFQRKLYHALKKIVNACAAHTHTCSVVDAVS